MMAEAEAERRRRIRASSLLELIPRLSPHLRRPTPLTPIADVLERAATEPIRALSSVPPQHGKTELISHAFVWHMLREPTRTHAYVTYQEARAHDVSRKVFRLAEAAGLRPEGNRGLWWLPQGGEIKFAGIDAGLTGRPVNGLLVIDDPHKNRAEAESLTLRDRVHGEFTATVTTRTHPTTSVLVNHTRWHVDDLIGRLKQKDRWSHQINLPALNEDGTPLWPELHPLWQLEEARESEYDWWSLYMGEPRPRGSAVFRDVVFYEAMPSSYRIGIGVDLAYTAKTRSDWSVAVVLAESEGIHYVVDVIREQSTPPEFATRLRQLKASYPGSHWLWYASTTEKGMADLLREEMGFPLIAEIAATDKFVRAQPAAAAWNAGRVRVVKDAPWASAFVSEIAAFTGVNDRHDDQVDALAAAFDVLNAGRIARPGTLRSQFSNYGGSPFAPRPPAVDPDRARGDGGLSWK